MDRVQAAAAHRNGDTLSGAKEALGLAGLEVVKASRFTAHVLHDFEASAPGELSVSRDEMVTVVVDVKERADQGWCFCRVVRSTAAQGDDTAEGFVPWFHLTTTAHDFEASSTIPQPPMGMTLMREAPDPEGGLWIETLVRRGASGALGLDIDDSNVICRVSPDSAADVDGTLQPGDVVHYVDGKNVAGLCCAYTIDPNKESYLFRVWRPPLGSGVESRGHPR